eukprot:CAMPEP_0197930488 /NCGR_PEP_ID=MMETSP1439-20131203/105534_1 /TAXON_ID=66791 /ORGANISM="Gonyaulax spinifera, Strain CCMP409" /LENGTH=112 /DNA_ID=CAMNT_0043553179 /DNA_START=33 /DNA_END=367 /DNA_ORIENTATION=+
MAPGLAPPLDEKVQGPDPCGIVVPALVGVLGGLARVAHEDTSSARHHLLEEAVLLGRQAPCLPVGECDKVLVAAPLPEEGFVPAEAVNKVTGLGQAALAQDRARGTQEARDV